MSDVEKQVVLNPDFIGVGRPVYSSTRGATGV